MKDRIAISRLNSQNPSMQIIENRRKTANPQMNSRKILRKQNVLPPLNEL